MRNSRRIGEFSKLLPKEQGGITRFGFPQVVKTTKTETLKNLGLDNKHIDRCEAMADIPIEVFEKHTQKD